MTREEAIEYGLKLCSSKGYVDLFGVIPDTVTVIYNDLTKHLDQAMNKAKTWDAHVALQEVKEYLEGKDERD